MPPIDPEITFIDRYYCVARIEFTHADQTEIGQVRRAVGIALRQCLQLLEILAAIEGEAQHAMLQ
jgi:hypothetical protein